MNTRPRLGVLVCLALVALAGCSGLAGQETPTRDAYDVPSTTETDAYAGRTATPTEIPPEEEIAPGITAEEVANPTRLFTEHQRILQEDGVEFHEHLVARRPNGSVYARLERRLWAPASGDRYYRLFHLVGGATPGESRRETYHNGTDRFELMRDGNETRYDHDTDRDPSVNWNRMRLDQVRRFVFAAEPERTTVTRIGPVDGPSLYRITMSVDEVVGGRPSPTFSDVNMTAYVDRRGLIRHMSLNYTATFDSRVYHVDRSLRFETGNVTIPSPDWLEEARRASDPDENDPPTPGGTSSTTTTADPNSTVTTASPNATVSTTVPNGTVTETTTTD